MEKLNLDDFWALEDETIEDIRERCRKSRSLPGHKRGERFFKGPIPWDWKFLAKSLPGDSTYFVGDILWDRGWILGSKRTFTFNQQKAATTYRVSVQSIRRGLRMLALAGLISIERFPGRLLVITIHPCPSAAKQMGLDEESKA